MAINQLGSSGLCALAQELSAVVQRYQPGIKTNLHTYRNQVDEWDEIYVVAEDDDGKERLVVRVSLNHLTPVERQQLQLAIGLDDRLDGKGLTEKKSTAAVRCFTHEQTC